MAELKTNRLILRNLTPEDWTGLQNVAADFNQSAHQEYDRKLPEDNETMQTLARSFSRLNHLYGVFRQKDGEMLGYVYFEEPVNPAAADNTWEMSFCFHRSAWKGRVLEEACNGLMNHLRTFHGAKYFLSAPSARDWLYCDFLQSMGFRLTGRGTESYFDDVKGYEVYHDTAIYKNCYVGELPYLHGADGEEPAGIYLRSCDLNIGNVYHADRYNWRLLHKEADRALFITDQVIDIRPYHLAYKPVSWAESDIRSWCNEGLFRYTDEKLQQLILPVETVTPDSEKFGTSGGETVLDKAFLLSADEAMIYFAGDEDRKARDMHQNKRMWWLRSPGRFQNEACWVGDDGRIAAIGTRVNYSGGFRPAMWLKITE